MFKAIGLLFKFLYHFCFVDQKDGRLSHTKFFSVAGYAIWCWAFPYTVIHGSQASFELWMVFGAVVIGNHTLQNVMINKSGAGLPADEAATWKGKFKAADAPPTAPAKPTITAPKPAAIVPDPSDLVGDVPSHK